VVEVDVEGNGFTAADGVGDAGLFVVRAEGLTTKGTKVHEGWHKVPRLRFAPVGMAELSRDFSKTQYPSSLMG
jgi:hypothetical protein